MEKVRAQGEFFFTNMCLALGQGKPALLLAASGERQRKKK